MNADKTIETAVSTLESLRVQLGAAQRGAMEPLLRAELSRLAYATERCVGTLAAGNAEAQQQLQAKQQRVAALAAANKEAIAAQRSKPDEALQPIDESTTVEGVDPTLRARLTAELLARQTPAEAPQKRSPGGVIDDWPADRLAAERSDSVADAELGPDDRLRPAVASDSAGAADAEVGAVAEE